MSRPGKVKRYKNMMSGLHADGWMTRYCVVFIKPCLQCSLAKYLSHILIYSLCYGNQDQIGVYYSGKKSS